MCVFVFVLKVCNTSALMLHSAHLSCDQCCCPDGDTNVCGHTHARRHAQTRRGQMKSSGGGEKNRNWSHYSTPSFIFRKKESHTLSVQEREQASQAYKHWMEKLALALCFPFLTLESQRPHLRTAIVDPSLFWSSCKRIRGSAWSRFFYCVQINPHLNKSIQTK